MTTERTRERSKVRFALMMAATLMSIPMLGALIWLMSHRVAIADKPDLRDANPTGPSVHADISANEKKTFRTQRSLVQQPSTPGLVPERHLLSPIATSDHAPEVIELARQLRSLSEDDQRRDEKLEELRQKLKLEFKEMHQKRAKEIEQTETRLAELKAMHQRRGDNVDRIVARRIDELLGRQDGLQWHARPQAMVPRPASPGRIVLPSTAGMPNLPENAPIPDPHRDASIAGPPRFPATQNRNVQQMHSNVQQFRLGAASDLSASMIEMFNQLAASTIDLEAAEVELAQMSLLREKNAVPEFELRKAELVVEKLKKAIDLRQERIEAFKSSLERELNFVNRNVEAQKDELARRRKLLEEGKLTSTQVQSALNAVAKAEHEKDTTEALVKQFARLLKSAGSWSAKSDQDERKLGVLNRIDEVLGTLMVERDKLLKSYGEDHPAVKSVNKQIEILRDELKGLFDSHFARMQQLKNTPWFGDDDPFGAGGDDDPFGSGGGHDPFGGGGDEQTSESDANEDPFG